MRLLKNFAKLLIITATVCCTFSVKSYAAWNAEYGFVYDRTWTGSNGAIYGYSLGDTLYITKKGSTFGCNGNCTAFPPVGNWNESHYSGEGHWSKIYVLCTDYIGRVEAHVKNNCTVYFKQNSPSVFVNRRMSGGNDSEDNVYQYTSSDFYNQRKNYYPYVGGIGVESYSGNIGFSTGNGQMYWNGNRTTCGTWDGVLHTHNYNTMIDYKVPPTCTEKGIGNFQCTCGGTEEQEVAALGHTPPDTYNDQDGGYLQKRCTVCMAELERQAISYKINYLGDDRTNGVMSPTQCTYDVIAMVSDAAYKKEGYTFKEWKFEESHYKAGNLVKNLTTNHNSTLDFHSIWSPNTYKVYFDLNDGDRLLGAEDKDVIYDAAYGELPKATKRDHFFMGWFTKNGLPVPVATDSEADRATGSEADRATGSEADRATGSEADRATGSEADRATSSEADRATGNEADRATGNEVKKNTIFDVFSGILDTSFFSLDPPEEPEEDWGNKILPDTIYTVSDNQTVYAKFKLTFEEGENGTNIKPGDDGEMGTGDDNHYWDGPDGIPGTDDDKLLYPGKDGEYGTEDDYYINDDGLHVYPGPDKIFGTEDDYIDNEDNTHTRPGPDNIFGTEDDEHYWNGYDKIPETDDDKLLYPGEDGEYGTEDDYWITDDGRNVYPGSDNIFGTGDDYIDIGNNKHIRPGEDGKLQTKDDEYWNNGKDGILWTEDDFRIEGHASPSPSNWKPEKEKNKGNYNIGKWSYKLETDKWSYLVNQTAIKDGWNRLYYQPTDRIDWYYFQAGIMQVGWITDDGKRYYLHEIPDGTRGHMYTGWHVIDGQQYYFDVSGALTIPD